MVEDAFFSVLSDLHFLLNYCQCATFALNFCPNCASNELLAADSRGANNSARGRANEQRRFAFFFFRKKIPLMNSDRTDYYIFIIQVCVIVAGCAPGGKVEEKLFNITATT